MINIYDIKCLYIQNFVSLLHDIVINWNFKFTELLCHIIVKCVKCDIYYKCSIKHFIDKTNKIMALF